MTDVSIVSGTYNRLKLLQAMVASARASVAPYHLSYEIVLVDGGSIDGTQEWIRQQPDCRLIEHHKLLGAVKAFNDGAFAAQGDYVILANDDVEFVGNGIYQAWRFMQDHPDCGCGCFWQDRGGAGWHVNSMPVVKDGFQEMAYYGQVAIYPKWLGDKLNWWCDPYRYQEKNLKPLYTYAGDNELSCRIYEHGYKILPVGSKETGARIHDREAADDLRKINNAGQYADPEKSKGHHPDSYAFYQMWKRLKPRTSGPIVRAEPMEPNPIQAKPRFVYLPIYERGYAVQKQQKRGLREALAKRGPVAEFDYVERFYAVGKPEMLTELGRLIDTVQPTIILTQLHNGGNIDGRDILKLRGRYPAATFVNWNGDYWPDNLLSPDGIDLARAFHLQTCVNLAAVEKYRLQGINAEYWQIGWEPDGRGHGGSDDYRHDVVFLGTGYSTERRTFVNAVRHGGYDFGLYGSGWPDNWSNGNTLYDFAAGCKIYRSCKISLGDSQWPDSGFVSNRIFQALAAGGSALAHQWFRGMENLGLVDGQTCIIWRNLTELQRKLDYYLAHDDERRRIAEAGERLAVDRHSFDRRVDELFGFLGIGQRVAEMEDWR